MYLSDFKFFNNSVLMGKSTSIRLFLPVLFLIIISVQLKAQEIHDLPFSYNSYSELDLKNNFDSLHQFSELIYANNKLYSVISSDPENNLFSTEHWPLGTWGNGYFSEQVHHRKYPVPNWGEDNQLYMNWYNQYTYNGDSLYLSSHPLTWHTGRRVIAYIHAYKNNPLPIYMSRIKEGLQYLMDEQNNSGGFNWYYKRQSQNSTADFNVQEDFIHGLSGIRALSEGFVLLNSIGDHGLTSELWNSIKSAGLYLERADIKDAVINNYQRINARSWNVWAIVAMYKATGKHSYLDLAEDITKGYLYSDYQRADGSWISPNELQTAADYWHDSYIQYHGIILRGLVEIYSLTDDTTFKSDLQTAIFKSINHVIDYNGEYGGNETRLNQNGFINKYHFKDESKNITDLYTASEFQQGLIYAKKSMHFSSTDLTKIDHLINGIFKSMISEIHKHKVPGVNMISLALALNDDFNHQNLTHSGSIHTLNTTFDAIVPVDFDNDVQLERDEIALYDFEDKLYNVYEINNDNAVFSQNTLNGPLFSLVTSGDFDNDLKDELAMYRNTYSDGLVSVMNEDLSWRGSIRTYNIGFDMIAPIDFDNDGYKDVVLYDKEGQLLEIYKNGINTPVFSGITQNGASFDLMTTGDFDADGEEEIVLYRTTTADGLVSILNKDLSWQASIRTYNTEFDMIATIDYDKDGTKDEVLLYDRDINLLTIYEIGLDQPIFSRYTNNGATFDLITTGNFDSDSDPEVAFYRKSDGIITILDIDLNYSSPNSAGRLSPEDNNGIIVNEIIEGEMNFSILNAGKGNALVQYKLAIDSYVEIIMYDLQGNSLCTIAKGYYSHGLYERMVDISKLPTGIYLYSILTNDSKKTVKVIHTN